MKTRIIALSVLVVATLFVIAQSLPISRFPNVGTPNDSDLFVLAQTQAPATNKNIRYDQLRGAIRSGLATGGDITTTSNGLVTYVITTSNSLSESRFETLTNGTTIGLTTNNNWEFGVTGRLSGTTVHLGVNVLAISNAIIFPSGGVQTNGNLISIQKTPQDGSTWYSGTNGIPETNGPRRGFEFHPSLMAMRSGETAGDPGSNSWNRTNLAFGSVGFGSNSLNRGTWSSILGGRGNTIETNSQVSFIGGGSNNVIAANSSFSFIGGGDLNDIFLQCREAFLGGGFDNQILSNTTFATLVGGQGNTAGSNHVFVGGGAANVVRGQVAAIVGGDNNTTEDDYCVVVGGRLNRSRGQFSAIGGGSNNVIFGNSGLHNVIAGGQGNQLGIGATFHTLYSFIGAGLENAVQNDCPYGVVVGGRNNTIQGTSSTNGFIGGGAFNNISGSSKFSTIVSGERNTISANYGTVLGASSNSVTSANGTVVGVLQTNSIANSVKIGAGLQSNFVHVTTVATTNQGLLRVGNGVSSAFSSVGGIFTNVSTPVASAGAAETNLITVTIPAHMLTNSQDSIMFRASGRFAATANGKQLKVVYGSETILDTTSQIVNSGAWTFEGQITRTGNMSQSVNAEFHGAGVTLFTTASSLDLAQTNGINTVLKITSTAAGDGDSTNRSMTVWYYPAP